jgi:hypothetical protein
MSKILVDHLYHHHLELLQQESQGQFDFIPVDFRTQDSQIENHLPEGSILPKPSTNLQKN